MTTYTITRALSRVKALKDKLDKAQRADYIATINSIKQGGEETNNLQKKTDCQCPSQCRYHP